MIASARPIFWSSAIRNLCLGRDSYYGNHWIQRLNLSKRFKPVLICRCVSFHRIVQGVKCAAQTITAVPAAGMARKRSYHLQPRCWNEHRWFNFSDEFQTALLNWLCKARKEVVVSLPNLLSILIWRSLSNPVVLNLFYKSYPFYRTRLPDLPPIHSVVLIYWKYEINKLLQFRMIYKTLHCLEFWFSKFTPWNMKFSPRGKFTPG